MKKTFAFDFEEENPNSLTYQLSLEESERLETRIEYGVPIIYMNRSAMLTMARILIKMALGRYSDQFHMHFRKDFIADGPDILTIMIHARDLEDK